MCVLMCGVCLCVMCAYVWCVLMCDVCLCVVCAHVWWTNLYNCWIFWKDAMILMLSQALSVATSISVQVLAFYCNPQLQNKNIIYGCMAN